jgi:Fe-S-cluster containining protein
MTETMLGVEKGFQQSRRTVHCAQIKFSVVHQDYLRHLSHCFLLVNRMIIDYPKSVRFQCLLCALCCRDTESRTRHILLLETEAQRISDATSKPIKEFALRTEGYDPYVYEIKKTLKERKCIVLKEKNCTIYELRPLVCRYYPFQLSTKSRKHRFCYTQECPGIGKGKQLRREYFESLLELASNRLNQDL